MTYRNNLDGKQWSVQRDMLTKMYHCPCGAPEHSQASSTLFAGLFKREDHPTPNPSDGFVPAVLQLDVPGPIEDTPDAAFTQGRADLHGQQDGDLEEDRIDVEEDRTDVEEDRVDVEEDRIDEDQENEGDGHDEEHLLPALPGIADDAVSDAVGEDSDISLSRATKVLLEHKIYVNTEYHCAVCLDCRAILFRGLVRGHRNYTHARSYRAPDAIPLPPESSFMRYLDRLGVARRLDFPLTPISPIEGVDIGKTGTRCANDGCPTPMTLYRNRDACNKHYVDFHHVPVQARKMIMNIHFHRVGIHDGYPVTYIEVEQGGRLPNDVLSRILATSNSPERLLAGGSAPDPLATRLGWDRYLKAAPVDRLRASAFHPDPKGDPILSVFRAVARHYYHLVAEKVSSLFPTELVLRYVHSPSPKYVYLSSLSLLLCNNNAISVNS